MRDTGQTAAINNVLKSQRCPLTSPGHSPSVCTALASLVVSPVRNPRPEGDSSKPFPLEPWSGPQPGILTQARDSPSWALRRPRVPGCLSSGLSSPWPLCGLWKGLHRNVETEFWICSWARERPSRDQAHLHLGKLPRLLWQREGMGVQQQTAMGRSVFRLPRSHRKRISGPGRGWVEQVGH